jgi:hypothetical protein
MKFNGKGGIMFSIKASRKIFNLLSLSAAMLSFIFLVGCATGGRYATFKRSRDLNYRYLNYEVLPDHKYYTSGGYDNPDAILALHTDYELADSAGLWTNFPNVDYEQMRKWIDTIAPEQDHRFTNGYFATYILDPDGKKVGVWYSIETFTTVKFLEGNKVLVYTPDVNMNIDFSRGLRGTL